MVKRAMFYHLENFVTGFLGPWFRNAGQKIYSRSENALKHSFGRGHLDECNCVN